MTLILIVLVILLCVGGLPAWGLHPYGYTPMSLGVVLLIVLIILLLTGHL